MLKKLSLGLLAIIVIAVGLSFTPNFSHLRNFAKWGKHTIHDYKTHPYNIVAKSPQPQYWPLDENFNKSGKSMYVERTSRSLSKDFVKPL